MTRTFAWILAAALLAATSLSALAADSQPATATIDAFIAAKRPDTVVR